MSSEDYRNEVRAGIKEANWTIWKVLPTVVLVGVILVILGWGLKAVGIIGKDIEREVVQHSRQYTETKASLLEKLHNDYLQLSAEIAEFNASEGADEIVSAKSAQQKAILRRMRTESDRMPESQVPTHIRSFLSTHRR